MDTIGQRLRHWRKTKNLSLYEVAVLTDTKEEDLFLIETDKSLPSRIILNNLRIFTEIDFRWFLLGDSDLQVQ